MARWWLGERFGMARNLSVRPFPRFERGDSHHGGCVSTVALAVAQPPIITTQPASVAVTQGGTTTLSVLTAGALSY